MQTNRQVGFVSGTNSPEGDIDFSDIKLPRINLVQKTGELGDTFEPGSIVYGKEIVLSDGTTPFTAVFVGLKKRYQQSLPYDPNGPQPEVYDTAQEVKDNNGSTLWGDDNYFAKMANTLVAIKAPDSLSEDDREAFAYDFGDNERWSLALWTLAKSQYTSLATKIITDTTTGWLREDGLMGGQFAISTLKKVTKGNTYWVPVAKNAGKTTPEFVQFLRELLKIV